MLLSMDLQISFVKNNNIHDSIVGDGNQIYENEYRLVIMRYAIPARSKDVVNNTFKNDDMDNSETR